MNKEDLLFIFKHKFIYYLSLNINYIYYLLFVFKHKLYLLFIIGALQVKP